jgi:MFS family permease
MNNRVFKAAGVLVGLLAVCLFARAARAPYLTDDSYQYLDAAQSVANGECLCTHVAHFDEQIASGRMPVPFTHFPPAYSLLIAALSFAGLSFLTAGFLISAASFLVTLWLIWDIGFTLGAKPWAIAALSLLWVTNSQALMDASRVGTEGVFTAAVTAIAALIARDVNNCGSRPSLLPYLGLIAGAAYSTRYAGLFLMPAVGIYSLWRWRETPAARWHAFGGLLASAALVGTIMVRNTVYTGSWRGGFNSGAHGSVRLVLAESFKSCYHLVFGDKVVARFDIWAAILCASLVVTLILIFRIGRTHAVPKVTMTTWAWFALILATYVAGIMFTSLLTIAADMTRYYRPVYPLVLAGAAPVLSIALRGRWIAAGIAIVGAIIAIHSRSLQLAPRVERHVLADQMLNGEVQPGMTARVWLLGRIPPGGIVVAADGQAVEYLLHRNVISVIEPQYTARSTDERGYRMLMTQSHARYLLLFPGLSIGNAPEQEATPFLRDLISGASAAPQWLSLVVRNSAVAIYECLSCSTNNPKSAND